MKLESDLLRPGQRGALHALLAHFSGSHRGAVAQIHLPAGYGKTLIMMLASIMFGEGKQTLVVCGSTGLREQLHHHFSGLYDEGSDGAELSKLGVLARSLLSGAEKPAKAATARVYVKVGVGDTNKPPVGAKVVVATPQSLDTYAPRLATDSAEVGLILVDEGHHIPAKTWSGIYERNSAAKVIVFTATPFRTDGASLPGRLAFSYPLVDAIKEGSVADCTIEALTPTNVGDQEAIDKQIVQRAKALLTLARGQNPAAKLLVKFNEISRLKELEDAYGKLLVGAERKAGLLVLHSGLKPDEGMEAMRRASEGSWRIALAVEMLSEGIDNPDIRVLAVHDNIQSLGHFVQVAGRAGRALPGAGGAAEPSYIVMMKTQMPLQLQSTNVQSLTDVAAAISSAVLVGEQRTTLLEQIEDGTISDETLTDAIPHLRLREHTRVFIAPATANLNWFRFAELDSSLVIGRVPKTLPHGNMQVAVVATPQRQVWLGELATVQPDIGLVLTYEPTTNTHVTRRYFFISTSSEHKSLVDVLVQRLADDGIQLLALGLGELKRIYGGTDGISYFNLGLRSRHASPLVERYRTVTGAEIELAVDGDSARGFSQGHVIARTYTNDGAGRKWGAVVGISAGATVWGPSTRKLESLCDDWMYPMAVKLSQAAAAPASTSVDTIPMGRELAFDAVPNGPGSAAFWGPKTLIEGVTLVAQKKDSTEPWTGSSLRACKLSAPVGDRAGKKLSFQFNIQVASGGPVRVTVEVRDTSQLFYVDKPVYVMTERSEKMSLAAWLRLDPPSLYLSDGSCLQGRAVSEEPAAGSLLQSIADNRFVMNWGSCNVLEEKPTGFEPPKKKAKGAPVIPKMTNFDPRNPNPTTGALDQSIFTHLAMKLIHRVEVAGTLKLVVCDDDSSEMADFIAIRGELGGHITVELYLCKATVSNAAGLRSEDVAELWSQAMRASQLLTRQSLRKHFGRGMNRMLLAPLLATAKPLAVELLDRATSIAYEVILVQPGLNLHQLSHTVSGAATSGTTVAHAFASITASLQRRGVRLMLIGSANAARIPQRAGGPAAAITFPDFFARAW